MKSWVRITFATSILIGGAIFFGHWSLVQFDYVFDNLGDFYVANTASVPLRRVQIDVGQPDEQIGTTTLSVATSTLVAISTTTATTTGAHENFSGSVIGGERVSTTSPEVSPLVVATSTNSSFSFTFPKRSDQLYIGCTYQISWQSPAIVDSLNLALFDAGTGKITGPIASGLARENAIQAESQNLDWKVGVVWPGRYYVEVSKINGVETKFRSKNFEISKMPADKSVSCK